MYGLALAGDHLLLFAEGRINRYDRDPHHIVMKRSADRGRTWSANRFVVRSDAGETFSNPTPVCERASGKLFLFYARNHNNDRTELFCIESGDGGASWSPSIELTGLFDGNAHGWMLHLPGPGHGIQLRDNRLLVQIWHRRGLSLPAAERAYGVSVIYSDDRGATWRAGGEVPMSDAMLNESRLAELSNGEVLLNARSGPFVTSGRYQSRSKDGGLTWSAPAPVETLAPAYATNAGMVAALQSGGATLLLLSRPDACDKRRRLAVYASRDEGASWSHAATLYEGTPHYSDLIALSGGRFGVIYGRDPLAADGRVEGNAARVVFAGFGV